MFFSSKRCSLLLATALLLPNALVLTAYSHNESDSVQPTLRAVESTEEFSVQNIANTQFYSEESERVIIAQGECGENLTWILYEDGELVISGSGAMTDWNFSDAVPWCDFRNNIQMLTVEPGITKIGNNTFSHCRFLESIMLPDTLTSIGEYAFSDCIRLTSVSLPKSLKGLERNAFGTCSALTEINVDPENTWYLSQDGVLFNKSQTLLIKYPAQKETQHYTVPESVTCIEDQAFAQCSNLLSVELQEGIKTIGYQAFAWSDSLTSISVPSSVTGMAYCAFTDCTALTQINIDPNNCKYSSLDGVWFDERQKELICYPAGKPASEYTVPRGVQEIRSGAFENCAFLTNVILPSGLTEIGSGAFSECCLLQHITLPDTLTDIGSMAFNNCVSLTAVTLPESLLSIEGGAFNGCKSLKRIAIPQSVTRIEKWAFSECMSLESVDVSADNRYYTSVDGVLFNKSMTTLMCYPSQKTTSDYTVPASVKKIDGFTFDYCNYLTHLVLPESLITIEDCSVYGCENLTSVTLSACLTFIGDSVFQDCPNLTIYGYDDTYASSYADRHGIPFVIIDETVRPVISQGACGENLTYILYGNGELIISGTGDMWDIPIPWEEHSRIIKTVVIEPGATGICNGAFQGCILESITLPETLTSIGNGAFAICDSLTNIAIPQSVTSIGRSAFNNCHSLANITLPENVTRIEWRTFFYCDSLTSITLPESCRYIGEYAFAQCKSLTDIFIPASVTEIDYLAFFGTPVTIYGYSGSYAETFANKYRYPFIAVDRIIPQNYPDRSIRLGDEPGIRFSSFVNTAQRTAADEYGFLITKAEDFAGDYTDFVFPENLLGNTSLEENQTATATIERDGKNLNFIYATAYTRDGRVDIHKVSTKDGEDGFRINAVLVNIPENQRQTDFAIRPYLRIGNRYFYGDVMVDNFADTAKRHEETLLK